MACRKLVGQVWHDLYHIVAVGTKLTLNIKTGSPIVRTEKLKSKNKTLKMDFVFSGVLFLNLKYFLFFPLIWSNFDTVPKTPQVHPGGTMLMRFDFGDKDGSKSKLNLQTFDHFKDIYSAIKKKSIPDSFLISYIFPF